ncbi:acylneuraminate cytidylyltransferase [Candidatus Nitrosopumilus koreensis AR1]|uniref:Acylneuraminate cytidylyltransferase n=1 Tax=Candidatus Nitrosopumilus koreensis AR1 TaxID=1229908 RepID=K0B3H7_9ARCH|nr:MULTISPECIES: glycosyltransferase family protein [Nitrosopumilus]AFS80019.1 acylneuraminate cytidylyltransferase [Candidatus Nitrosopumilus koreensis AR1]
MIGCIIQARMGSTRLPGKVLMNLDNEHNLLHFILKQIGYSKSIDEIIIATTTLPEDKQIVSFCKQMNVKYFCGSINDVLSRYFECAKNFSLDIVVRITSDCPLIDPNIIDSLIKIFVDNEYDYVSTHLPRTFPQGSADIEVFSFETLKHVHEKALKPSEREHVTPFIYNNPDKFSIYNYEHETDFSKLKWSVDKKNDLHFVQEIVKRINERPILTADILDVLKKEPELKKINKDHILNEGYKKSLEEDKKLGF